MHSVPVLSLRGTTPTNYLSDFDGAFVPGSFSADGIAMVFTPGL